MINYIDEVDKEVYDVCTEFIRKWVNESLLKVYKICGERKLPYTNKNILLILDTVFDNQESCNSQSNTTLWNSLVKT
jgi:hypothetical protein